MSRQKSLFFPVFAVTLLGFVNSDSSFARSKVVQEIWLHGSKVAEVTDQGEVWIDGVKAGTITKDGEIWVAGEKEGDLTKGGEVWKAGNKIGEITKDGDVWKDGDDVGDVSKDGTIWIGGSREGSFEGGDARHAAIIVFFEFYKLPESKIDVREKINKPDSGMKSNEPNKGEASSENMNADLKKIQRLLDRYDLVADEFVREFNDEMTLAYFSDRFGPDHPMSDRADYGARIAQRRNQLKQRIREFAAAIENEFPEPTD